MRLLRRRLDSRPHGILYIATSGFCEPLKPGEFLVAFPVESDHGRPTVVDINDWTLPRLCWRANEGWVTKLTPHFNLEENQVGVRFSAGDQ